MKKINVLVYLLFITFLISCEKENFDKVGENSNVESQIQVDLAKVYYIPTNDKEKALVENLSKISEVLKKMYHNNDNLKVVNAAIMAEMYTDQSILLKDLIYPQQSRLKANERFTRNMEKFNVNLDDFSKNFWDEVNSLKDDKFSSYLNTLDNFSEKIMAEDNITIYSPYLENFEYIDDGGGSGGVYYEPKTTLVVATADADEGIGSEPYYVNGVLQYYKDVLVNDDYAYLNPTQIIGVNGVEPYNYQTTSTQAVFPPGNPIDLPDLTREVKQVFVGEVRVNGHQYDRFISFTGNGGGSEIIFTRADGYLKLADGHVQADMFFSTTKSISRYNIRKKNWVNYTLEWDMDWEEANLEQNLAIYEEDNRNSLEISGEISTTLKLSDMVSITVKPIGYKATVKSDDTIIYQTNFKRDVFFVLNRLDMGCGLRNGWQIRNCNGNVNFTLMDRTYY